MSFGFMSLSGVCRSRFVFCVYVKVYFMSFGFIMGVHVVWYTVVQVYVVHAHYRGLCRSVYCCLLLKKVFFLKYNCHNTVDEMF